LQPELAAFLAPRVQQLRYLGEFFQCTAYQLAALLNFLRFTEERKHALPLPEPEFTGPEAQMRLPAALGAGF
jgi:hypothetical protein